MATQTYDHTILVVEDDYELNRLFCKYLGASGYHVNSAFSLAEARDALTGYPPPDMLVLDLALIDGKGTEILEMIHHDPRLAHVRVVIVSGRAFARDCSLGKYDVEHILQKPVTPRGLAAFVRNVI